MLVRLVPRLGEPLMVVELATVEDPVAEPVDVTPIADEVVTGNEVEALVPTFVELVPGPVLLLETLTPEVKEEVSTELEADVIVTATLDVTFEVNVSVETDAELELYE